eukprot:TRINITY_DN2372_c0_g1_i1.p1 TRINITY_DN2372_c0_g1~~TRINITY_DN2372_c0_g1_i1.p1  ORF type:complete len:509 (-),score=79.55 TRINITY_DN2372_c0_g1_i1:444-1943(-)
MPEQAMMFAYGVAEAVAKHAQFVHPRGDGYHILFDESEMSPYFDAIRRNLENKISGAILAHAVEMGNLHRASSNQEIWTTLLESQKFNGIDFEHAYGIMPDAHARARSCGDKYNFEETIVLSHTLLLVPVMQHYGPLTPKLNLSGPTKEFEQPQPLLAVGMIGDCVKGPFFENISKRADAGCGVAIEQRETLTHPRRLQQKLRGLIRGLLRARPADCTLRIDATLVGTGAFGGSVQKLAQPFVDSLDDCSDLAAQDEVNFFIFPPPKPEDLVVGQKKCKTELNPKCGLGAASAAENVLRVVVAGFDPVSLTPHGVKYRAVSAEGQLCHTTDMLQRLNSVKGQFVRVEIPTGDAWESPAAFFAGEHKTKQEEGYRTVRFVPAAAVQARSCEEVQLVARENKPPRAWNGDTFNGWTLLSHETPTGSWLDAIYESVSEGVLKVFRKLDDSGTGLVAATSLQYLLGSVGVSEKEAADAFRQVGINKDGMIDINRFLSWLNIGN